MNFKIKEAKDGYRGTLERKLQRNNMREVWSGMSTITGFKPTSSGNAFKCLECLIFIFKAKSCVHGVRWSARKVSVKRKLAKPPAIHFQGTVETLAIIIINNFKYCHV